VVPYTLLPGFPAVPPYVDFTYYYDGARVGLEHGWSHLYDIGLQRAVYERVRPALYPFKLDARSASLFASPPPLAWLVAPFSLLPYAGAYFSWAALNVLVFATGTWLAVPGARLARLAGLLGSTLLYPLLTSLQMGQASVLAAYSSVFAWLLLARGRPVIAGLLLAGSLAAQAFAGAASAGELVGPESCRSCHAEAYRAWQGSAHARAFSALAPDQQKRPVCLQCHAPELARETDADHAREATIVVIGIHPFVVGTPARAVALRRVMENFKAQKQVWIADTDEVAAAAK